jgi:hypothetical protein
MHLFYKKAGSDDLYWIENDGTTWSRNEKLVIQSPGGGQPQHTPKVSGTPAAALTGTNGLFLFYKAASSNDIMVIRSDDSWSGDVPLRSPNIRPPVSDHNPAATMFGTDLILVWKNESSNDLWVAKMDQFLNWSWGVPISLLTNGRIAPKSNISPNVIAFNDKLFIIYKGESSDDLYLTIFDSKDWSGDVKISSQPGGIVPESSDRPSLVIFNNILYMIYKGPNNTDLNYAVFDGNVWQGNSEIWKQPGGIHPESDSNPGLLWLDNRMWLAYKSPNNTNLNYAYFDGTTWSGNSQITVQRGGQNPQSDFSPLAVADP